jgi:hypothetical protein
MSEVKTFLLLPQGEGGKKISQSYIAVKQAYINHEIAIKTERVGRYGIIFTTEMDFREVTENLKMKESEPYLLIELTGNISSDSIVGFLPDTHIDELRGLNLDNLKDSAEWLKKELEKALDSEDYLKAAEIRDKLNAKSEN